MSGAETIALTPVVLDQSHGFPADGILRVAVHVRFDLTPGDGAATLGSGGFPHAAAWSPACATYALALNAGPPIAAALDLPGYRAGAWAAFFPPGTPIRAVDAAASGRVLERLPHARWYDAAGVHALVRRRYAAAAFAAAHGLPNSPSSEPAVVTQARNFFASQPKPAVAPALSQSGADPDVHDVFAALHDSPSTMQALGLVFVLTAPWPGGKPAAAKVRIVPSFLADSPTIITPTLDYAPQTAASGFADPRSIVVLPINAPFAAHQLAYAANRVAKGADSIAATPALRSSGMAIATATPRGAALRLQQRAERAARVAQGAALTEADLDLGQRVDVWDDRSRAWHSLCAVQETVTRNGLTLETATEGFVSTSLTLDAYGTPRMHDGIAFWQGWSLSAPRPDTPVRNPDPAQPPRSDAMIVRDAAVGSLPALRYGRRYRFRLRRVTVTGHGLPPGGISGSGADDFTGATDPVLYARTEPLPPPAITFVQSGGPGDPVTRRGEAVAAIVVSTAISPTASSGQSDRWIVPPAAPVDFAERHGVLDHPGGAPDAGAFALLSDGALWSGLAPGAYPTAASVNAAQSHPAGGFKLPYLPDPLARSVAIVGLAGSEALGLRPGTSVIVPFAAEDAAYPAGFTPFILRTVAGPAGTTTGSISVLAGGVVMIVVPAGVRVSLGLLCVPSDLDIMAVRDWLREGALRAAADLAAFDARIAAGAVPQIAPMRRITLTHAVERPMAAPAFTAGPACAVVAADPTGVTVTGSVTVHASSTGAVDLAASWDEWVDGGPGTAAPQQIPMQAHLGQLRTAGASGVTLKQRYDFHDSKVRVLRVIVSAVSDYAEFFPPTAPQATTVSATATLIVPAQTPPPPPHVLYAVPTFGWFRDRDPVGAATNRRVGNSLRIYLERPWFVSGSGEMLAVLIADGVPFDTIMTSDAANHATMWGSDPLAPPMTPLQGGIAMPGHAAAENFGGSQGSAYAVPVTVPGVSTHLTALGFAVQYEPLTERWFADIEVDGALFATVYAPFVRLVLARLQINAVAGAMLSAPTIAGFYQLPSDRVLQVSITASAVSDVNVHLSGPKPNVASDGGIFPGLSTHIALNVAFGGIGRDGKPHAETPLYNINSANEDPNWMDQSVVAPQLGLAADTITFDLQNFRTVQSVTVTVEEWEAIGGERFMAQLGAAIPQPGPFPPRPGPPRPGPPRSGPPRGGPPGFTPSARLRGMVLGAPAAPGPPAAATPSGPYPRLVRMIYRDTITLAVPPR